MSRAHRSLPAGTDPPEAAAAQASLAVTVETATDPVVVEHAQTAFATAVQTTSYIAAAILVVSAVVAWRGIPSSRTIEVSTRGAH